MKASGPRRSAATRADFPGLLLYTDRLVGEHWASIPPAIIAWRGWLLAVTVLSLAVLVLIAIPALPLGLIRGALFKPMKPGL